MVKKLSPFIFSLLVICIPMYAQAHEQSKIDICAYVEERDLKNIEQLCIKNAQTLVGDKIQDEDLATFTQGIQTRMQGLEAQRKSPDNDSVFPHVKFHKIYVKVAYFNSEFVGFVMYGWPSSFLTGEKKFTQGTIELLVVEEKFRNKGYGQLLLDIAIADMQERGADIIEVGVVADNKAAIEFYKKNGFLEPVPSFECVTLVRIFSSELIETLKSQGIL